MNLSYTPTLRSITIEPERKADMAFIGLHGLGADGRDFEAIAREIKFPSKKNIRFIFPHAPQIPVTINMKSVMPAWYDIVDMRPNHKVDKRSVDVSHVSLIRVLEHQIHLGINPKNIIIAGFSQGGAIAAEVALNFPRELGGLVMLSSYLLFPQKIRLKRIPQFNDNLPIFFAYGEKDEMVPPKEAKRCVDILKDYGFRVTSEKYEDLAHSVNKQEISALSDWIAKVVG